MGLLDHFGLRLPASMRIRLGLRLIGRDKAAKGFHHFVRAALAGSAQAQYHVGLCYLRGTGVPQSTTEAATWIAHAAHCGLAEAQFHFALLLLEPDLGEPDPAAALNWARSAAQANLLDAQALAGSLLSAGPPELRDLHEAERWYERAADGGSPQASLGLGLLLLARAKQPADWEAAAARISAAAEAGIARAGQLVVGLEHFSRSFQDGASMAVQGHPAAGPPRNVNVRSADIVAFGEAGAAPGRANRVAVQARLLKGMRRDDVSARTLLNDAARAGSVDAIAALGEMFANGRGGRRDVTVAVSLLRVAAERGHAGAMFALGALFSGGYGVQCDRPVARQWLTRADALGHPRAGQALARIRLATDVPAVTIQ